MQVFNNQNSMMSKSSMLVLILGLVSMSISIYIPELQVCASTTFMNQQLRTYGPLINTFLDNATIPDEHLDQKIEGVRVQLNLTKIKQKFVIDWKDSKVVNIEDYHTFTLLSKNIDVYITAEVQFKIAGAIKQKGTLNITIEKLKADTTLTFLQPSCETPNSGLGFNIQILKLFIDQQALIIRVQGHGIDNLILKTVLNLLKTRLPSIIQKMAINQVNPLISKNTCTPIQQFIQIQESHYILTLNTTNVPHFVDDDLFAEVDVTFVNTVTNATNNQVQNDNLPEKDLFEDKAQFSTLLSSNMLNSVLWLAEDSNLISAEVTNSMLNGSAPIELITTNLSILIPGLMKWPQKQVILVVGAANKFSHLYVRNGKIISALSISANFVVDNGKQENQTTQACINANRCIEAVNLNITLSLSVSLNIDGNVIKGILHSVSMRDISVISKQIDIKTETLQKILNIMIGSFRPQINQQLATGMAIPDKILEILAKYDVQKLFMIEKKDFAGVGVTFKRQ